MPVRQRFTHSNSFARTVIQLFHDVTEQMSYFMARTASLKFLYNSCCIIVTSIPKTILTIVSVEIVQLSRTCLSTGHLYSRNELYTFDGLQSIKASP